MSKPHVFLLDSQFFVTTETLPPHPRILGSTHGEDDAQSKEVVYHAALTSIRERAVLVQNHYEALGMLFRAEVKEEYKDSPDAFRAWRDKYMLDGSFHPLDCEVRYEEQPFGFDYDGSGNSWRKVAILSPIEAQGDKWYGQNASDGHKMTDEERKQFNALIEEAYEESQDDLWDDIRKTMIEIQTDYLPSGIDYVNGVIIKDLKSRFTITRNPK